MKRHGMAMKWQFQDTLEASFHGVHGAMSDYDVLFKLVLAGEACVGKTSLLRRYCDDCFQEQYQPLGCLYGSIP